MSIPSVHSNSILNYKTMLTPVCIGVGFSTGKIEAKNEVQISQDFVGFFKNFEVLFGIENYKIYVTVRTALFLRFKLC